MLGLERQHRLAAFETLEAQTKSLQHSERRIFDMHPCCVTLYSRCTPSLICRRRYHMALQHNTVLEKYKLIPVSLPSSVLKTEKEEREKFHHQTLTLIVEKYYEELKDESKNTHYTQQADLLKSEESQKEMKKQKDNCKLEEISHKYDPQLQEEKETSMKPEFEKRKLNQKYYFVVPKKHLYYIVNKLN
ncbi:uncharacterized [Tachysurus ichikawai]